MSTLIASDAGGNASREAVRVLDICNACRYCEGYCPVFQELPNLAPLMTSETSAQDLAYTANLCHNCTACYHACQYKPPHEYAVNVPHALTAIRHASYAQFVWPSQLGRAFSSRGVTTAIVMSLIMCALFALVTYFATPDSVRGVHIGPGAFYQVLPHNVIVGLAGSSLGFALLAMMYSGWRYWRCIAPDYSLLAIKPHLSALQDVSQLAHLDGGQGQGCNTQDAAFSNARRYFHQLTLWGFMLCFAATSTATIYELVLGRLSPFPLTSLPVVLGTAGGIGLIIGPIGLMWSRRNNTTGALDDHSSNSALSMLLVLISITGFAVTYLRETQWMGLALLIHLAIVLSFFIAMPYSKFVHGLYRYLALLRLHQN